MCNSFRKTLKKEVCPDIISDVGMNLSQRLGNNSQGERKRQANIIY